MKSFFRSSVQNSVQRFNLLGALVQRSFGTITKAKSANARIDSICKCLLPDIGQRVLLKSRTPELVSKCPMPTFAPSRNQRRQVFMRGRVVQSTSRAIGNVMPEVKVEDWLAQPWRIKSNVKTELLASNMIKRTKHEDNLKLLKTRAKGKSNSNDSSTPRDYNPKTEFIKTGNVETPSDFRALKKGSHNQEKNIMDCIVRWTNPIYIRQFSENVFDTELCMLCDGFLPLSNISNTITKNNDQSPRMGLCLVESRCPKACKDCTKGSRNQVQASLHTQRYDGQLAFSIQPVENKCILSLTTASSKMTFNCDEVPLSCVITSIDDVNTIIQLKLPNAKRTDMTVLNKEFKK